MDELEKRVAELEKKLDYNARLYEHQCNITDKLRAENQRLREAAEELLEAEGGTGNTDEAWARLEALLEDDDEG